VNVKELRKVLEELQEILAAANARQPSKDVATFLKLFDGHEDETVSRFLSDLEARLKARTAPARSEPRAADRIVVARYTSALREAGIDEPLFRRVFDQIGADKAVQKPEADAIAFDYIGYGGGRSRWPNRKAALTAIEDWFKHQAYEAVKMIQLEKARYAG